MDIVDGVNSGRGAALLDWWRRELTSSPLDDRKIIYSSLAGATLAAQYCCEAVQVQRINAQKGDSCSKEQVRSLK
jgi:hypothetical protein